MSHGKTYRVAVGDDGAILYIDVDIAVRDLEAIYHLAKVDVSNTGGAISVGVLAQGKLVICRELVLKEFCNKAPGDLVRIRGIDGCLRKRDRTSVELGMGVHGTKPHGLTI